MTVSAESITQPFIRGQKEIILKSGTKAWLHWADAILLDEQEAIGITDVLEQVFLQSNQLQNKRNQWFQPFRQDVLVWAEVGDQVVGTGAIWHPDSFSGIYYDSPYQTAAYKLHSGAVLEEYREDGIGGNMIAQRMQIIQEIARNPLIFSDFGNFGHYSGFLRKLDGNLDIFKGNETFLPFYTATFDNLIKIEFVGRFSDRGYPYYPCHTYMLEMHNLDQQLQNQLYNMIYTSGGNIDMYDLNLPGVEFFDSGVDLPDMALDPQGYLDVKAAMNMEVASLSRELANGTQPAVIIKEQKTLRIAVC